MCLLDGVCHSNKIRILVLKKEKSFTKDDCTGLLRSEVSSVEELFCVETGPQRETGLHVIIPGEEKVLLEDPSRNGQSTLEEK